MRLSHIENRLEQQLTIMDLIVNSVDNLTKVGYARITSQRVNARLSDLKDNWEKFSLIHDVINLSISKLNAEEKVHIQKHLYFTNNLYSSTHDLYLDAIEKMTSIICTDSESTSDTPIVQSSSHNSSFPVMFHHARLPRIDIPKFNGSPSDWLSFKDLFNSLIIDNPSLSPVEKLQYLKTSLIGSASHLLKNTTLTSDNFQKAWDALISFYENKRLLVNSALQSLLSLKRMTKESSTEMEHLYTNIMQIYRTFDTLQRPVQMWDDFLVFIAVQRLDSESVKAWEHHLGSVKEPPTWTQFNDFLITRLLSLQAFEKSRTVKPFNQYHPQVVKSHFQGKNKDVNSQKSVSCPLCSANHYTSNCPQYSSKSIQQRIAIINKNRLCYNCLGTHKASCCRNTKRCLKCGHKHHTSIHQTNPKINNFESASSTSENSTLTTSKLTESQVLHSFITQGTSCILLATAQVLIISENEEITKARVLIDQGSEISLISEHLVQQLHLPRSQSFISLVGIGAKKSNKTKGLTQFILRSRLTSNAEFYISAHILPKLTTFLPSVQVTKQHWPHLEGLTLADPNFTSPGCIDIILGADIYPQIIEDGIKKGDINSPIAQRTKFGWIISGPSNDTLLKNNIQSYHVSMDRELYDLLRQFWKLEEIPSTTTSSLSVEHQECEQHFKSTHSRDLEGRYIVRLPFKQSASNLGESRTKALRIITNLSKKFTSDKNYAQSYYKFLQEYENLHHMIRVPASEPEPQIVYYLPHHGVIRESSLTTKLRVVFNGSSHTTTGVSLNDILHIGAKLQTDVFNVLLWFRQFRYVFTTDIEKMYRQIKVHQDDWNFQRILWIDEYKKLVTFQLSTVTYGLACAPFLALRTIKQLIQDEGDKFPLAVPSLIKGRYVDDIFGGADTIQQAQQIVQQLDKLCMAGGFPLKKWVSNHTSVIESIPQENRINFSSVHFQETMITQILGMNWNSLTDTFQFSVTLSSTTLITKRNILSTIAKLFDPLGFLAPVTITAKIFIQELWSLKLGWDDSLPLNASRKWISFIEHLQEIPKLEFPRWIGLKSDNVVEIHGFCDASQRAICAVVFIRSTSQKGNVNTHLLCSKTKVAPLKKMTIPRLELSGAVLVTKLVSNIVQILQFNHIPIFMWTDSAITFTWINNHPSRWKDFVHNRVCYIHEKLPQAIWRFIPGIENPADCATRGLTPIQLQKHSIWWFGPCWLSQEFSTWPQDFQLPSSKDNLEERLTQVSVTSIESNQLWDLIYKFSSLTRLLRVTALCIRAIKCFQKDFNSSLTTPITTQELEKAKIYWIKSIQQIAFHQELKILSNGKTLSRSNPLIRLAPFLDECGLLRVGGRLQFSLLPENAKHPFILPKKSPLSTLIIYDAHQRTLHGGTQLTLSFIRNNYWIIGGRSPVRSFILKCVKCARYRNQRAQQIMGQLPPEQLTPSRPFLNSGIDYAGPFLLKNWKGRNSRTYKAYIVLFICHATSAIHLELVTDYTTEAFIAAFKRFTARRGICSTLMSDCGTNLKGASSELKNLFSVASTELGRLATLLAKDGTQWKFIPPAAPHFGGKWEAGVKSVKHHLRRVVGNHLLTYEEMNTFLTQTEAVLNSRPLCALTNDPDDLNALTPGHFLIGNAPTTLPEPSLENIKLSYLSRWQVTRQMIDSFWSHWSRECLQRHLAIYKWNRDCSPLQEGTLVLVTDERYPPSKWPLGRVTKTHEGKDGRIRVVSVRTQTTILKRPIVKLCPLPISTHSM